MSPTTHHKACRSLSGLLIVALLLFIPAVLCAGAIHSDSASHPCCPKSDCPMPHGHNTAPCVCMDRQPVTASTAPASDHAQLLPPAESDLRPSPEPPHHARGANNVAVLSPQDRSVLFHRLLI
jgi:hypothetical protein